MLRQANLHVESSAGNHGKSIGSKDRVEFPRGKLIERPAGNVNGALSEFKIQNAVLAFYSGTASADIDHFRRRSLQGKLHPHRFRNQGISNQHRFALFLEKPDAHGLADVEFTQKFCIVKHARRRRPRGKGGFRLIDLAARLLLADQRKIQFALGSRFIPEPDVPDTRLEIFNCKIQDHHAGEVGSLLVFGHFAAGFGGIADLADIHRNRFARNRGKFSVQPVERLDISGKIGVLRPGNIRMQHHAVNQTADIMVAVVAEVLIILIGVHRVDADSRNGGFGIDSADNPALETDDVHDIVHGSVEVFADHRLVLGLPYLNQPFPGKNVFFKPLFQLGPFVLLHRHHSFERIQDIHAADDVDRLPAGNRFGTRLDRLEILLLENCKEKLAVPFRPAEAPEFGIQTAPDAESGL